MPIVAFVLMIWPVLLFGPTLGAIIDVVQLAGLLLFIFWPRREPDAVEKFDRIYDFIKTKEFQREPEAYRRDVLEYYDAERLRLVGLREREIAEKRNELRGYRRLFIWR